MIQQSDPPNKLTVLRKPSTVRTSVWQTPQASTRSRTWQQIPGPPLDEPEPPVTHHPLPRTPDRWALQSVFCLEDFCCTFPDYHAGGHGVAGGDARHDGAVGDPQVVDSVDVEVTVDD